MIRLIAGSRAVGGKEEAGIKGTESQKRGGGVHKKGGWGYALLYGGFLVPACLLHPNEASACVRSLSSLPANVKCKLRSPPPRAKGGIHRKKHLVLTPYYFKGKYQSDAIGEIMWSFGESHNLALQKKSRNASPPFSIFITGRFVQNSLQRLSPSPPSLALKAF